MTRTPGRAAAVLALLRPLADEIVVAVDDRIEPAAALPLTSVADCVVRYPYAEPVERPWAWLHSQCRGTWVLTVDDDEIPSRALLAALPDLIGARDVTHYWLPCRWLYPSRDRYLAGRPWWPDYHIRLVLNDARVRTFPGRMHIPISALGPGRYLEAAFYHADLLLAPREAREQKAARYERLYPGRRVAGRPLDKAYYLPEDVDPPTREVPAEDRELVAAVLSPVDEPVPISGGQVRSAGRDEIDRHWAGRQLGGYAARLTLVEPVPALWTDVQDTLDVRVENLGADVWPWGGGGLPEIRLGCRWLHDGDVREGPRAPLPADLGPGGSEIVPLPLVPPSEPGDYTLEIDLVHEHVRWFDVPLRVEVSVAAPRLVAVLDPASREGLAVVLEALDPVEEPVVLARDPDGLSRIFAGAIRPAPEDSGRMLVFARLVIAYRRALAGTQRLVVPVTLLERERRLPLLAAVVAARSIGIATATSAGRVLTATAVLSRRLR